MSTGVITAITGTPGAGKTLRAVAELLDDKHGERRRFSVGVEWLQDRGVTSLPDVTSWLDPAIVPDGSVLLVDEADMEGRFPQRDAGKRLPDYIGELKRVRHRGIQLIVVTQHPKQIDVAVRRLVGRHLHLERLFGMNAAQVFEWNKITERVDDRGARFGAVKAQWPYPKELFGVYRSASEHTVARKIPWRLAIIPVLLVLMVLLGWGAYKALASLTETDDPIAAAADAPGVLGAAAATVAQVTSKPGKQPAAESNQAPTLQKWRDLESYAIAHTPRVASRPWSAPIFDGREPMSQPELFCVSSETGRCICHTEQGTRYPIELAQCHSVVASGGMYNPYKQPRQVAVAGTSPASAKSQDAPQRSTEPVPGITAREVAKFPPQTFPGLAR